MINNTDLIHLRRCVKLAESALEQGDEPFGAILVSACGEVLAEDHNRVAGGDYTQHAEFSLAKWATTNLTPEERMQATIYTSGEHCPMCAAAHGWVGLGRIVYASSSEQLAQWLGEMGITSSRVRNLPIDAIISDTIIDGPVPELAEQIRELHRLFHASKC